MLPEYFSKYKKEYIEAVESLSEEFATISKSLTDSDKFITLITAFQQNVIDICTGFEESWLTDRNEIVAGFEEICELLYKLSEGDKGTVNILKSKIDSLRGAFDRCYHTSERKLSIALIARNEGRYLREWIEYHKMVGADYFYVYDHESTDDSYEVLKDYISQGMLEYRSVEGEHNPAQLSAYNDAVLRSRYETRYLAFIDADEFLVPMKHENAVEAIEEIFRSYEETPFKFPGSGSAGGIGINWRVFGTSGHDKPVDGLVIENYDHRGPDRLMINTHIKTICKPLCVKTVPNPHFAIYHPGYWCISEHGSMIPAAFFYDSIGDILRVNHYYTKSEQEYRERRMNYVRAKQGRQRQQTEEEVTHTNEILDDSMQRFIPSLKERL